MNEARLSPRQSDCLRLIWERQATSKEIAAELGISSRTVDGYIAEAVDALGARDRRDAAAIAFGGQPRHDYGGQSSRVAEPDASEPTVPASTNTTWPWRANARRNDMSLAQTLAWIVAIAIGSLCALSLAVSVGNGVRPLARPLLQLFDRLTH